MVRSWLLAFLLILASCTAPMRGRGLPASPEPSPGKYNYIYPYFPVYKFTKTPTPTPTPCPTSTPTPTGTPEVEAVPAEVIAVLDEINRARLEAGLSPLKLEAKLYEAAQAHSVVMRRTGVVTHNLPDCVLWLERILQFYRGSNVLGQVVGGGFSTPEGVVTAWLNSTQGHRQILLEEPFVDVEGRPHPSYHWCYVGIGYAEGGFHRWYWTADFAGCE